MDNDKVIRDQLVNQLRSRSAHATFDDVIEDIPPDKYGEKPEGLPYSLWQLLEHIRLTQKDILDFCIDPEYQEPRWPEEYWPEAPSPSSPEAWKQSVASFRDDLHAMIKLAQNPEIELTSKIPHGNGQTYLREVLLVADHNAYHLGEMVVLRRLLGIWPGPTLTDSPSD